jgi:hypothetical protein
VIIVSEKMSLEDVLKPYKSIIDNYDSAQKVEWTRWSDRLPRRVAKVTNMLEESIKTVDKWQNLNYVFIVIAAAVPVIMTILIEVLSLTHLASLIDLVFPAGVGVIEKILSNASKKKEALISVYSPYSTLLSDIIIDIFQKTYDSNKQTYESKWADLNKILMNAGIAA